MQRISIIGLGKLGAPIAVAIAHRGHKVIGVDLDENIVSAVNNQEAHIHEPEYEENLQQHHEKIHATSDIATAIAKTDITIVVVPTPSGASGLFTNKHVLSAMETIGRALRGKKKYHLVAILSTVIPESMDTQIAPQLAKSSGKKIGPTIGLCYNPAFVALGSVIENYLNPDFILIGESDEKAGRALSTFYTQLCTNIPEVKRMNFVNAEITKLALNTYVTTKISYANMLAELCENIPGGNVHDVTEALGHDRRIGHRYLTGATAYGGPCFPRDNKALTAVGKKAGVSLRLPKTTDTLNDHQITRLVELCKKEGRGKSVALLGLTYRSDSDVVEASVGIELAQKLASAGYKVSVYDPVGMENAKKILRNTVSYALSAKDCVSQATCIIITTNWPEFADLKPSDFQRKNPLLIDCWQIIPTGIYKKNIRYRQVGVHTE